MCIEPEGVRFVARIKDLIVRGGSNISPVEVEQVLGSHPAVVEVAVAGVHDPVLGQRVMALVRLKTDATQNMLSDVLASAVPRLADSKLPECLFATQTLPRNATGKIDRQQVSAMLGERFAARSAEGASAQSVRP